MLALVHKNILPLEHRVPFLGDVIFFSEGLKFNIEWILFGTYLTNPWAPFSSFQLKRKSLPIFTYIRRFFLNSENLFHRQKRFMLWSVPVQTIPYSLYGIVYGHGP